MNFNIFNDTLDNCTFSELHNDFYNKTTTNSTKLSNEPPEMVLQSQIINSTTKPSNNEISFDDSIFFSTCDLIKDETINQNKLSTNESLKFNSFQSNSTPLSKSINQSINQSVTDAELSLSNWGLPPTILDQYKSKKITKMFRWQVECLKAPNVLNAHRNLIYSAPTSAGKTLVAELIIIKTILERHKKVLFILPFVSVVREKMFYFQEIFNQCGVRVDGFMGSYQPPGGFSAVQIAICTIEKANSLINRLLQDSNLEEIGAIVIDEIHLLGDPSRGYLLELLLTKLLYICKKNRELQIQIVGMSATLPNLELLAKWLDAELFVTDFRPIPLYEQIQINNELFNNEFELLRRIETDFDTDTDNILQLCLETIKESCSVLIFCPTKNWCENLAQQIAVAFWKLGTNNSSETSHVIRQQLKTDLITEILEQLKYCPVGLDEILKRTISFAVAFHHAGLTMDERDIIEMGFRNGAIRVLVATSTLSSGVNLPAKRVIIRTPVFHNKPIDALVYRQMIGRAGRMGRDTSGESILICQKNETSIARDLVSTQLAPIESCLDGNNGRLKRAILQIIASGVAETPADVELFTNCTLLAQSLNNNHDNPIEETLQFLINNEFIRLQQHNYIATNLGKACLSASIPPEDGLALLAELEKARQCFVLDTELHLIYLVTPYTACQQWTNIDWMFYLNLWERLPLNMKRVGELIGIKESYIVNATRCKLQTNTPKLYHKFLIHKRFFIALALQDLVNETPLNVVCNKFGCNRGMLQSLQQTAATFAGMVTTFSRQLGWLNVELLIAQFQQRLQFGVSRDLLDLMRLSLLNNKTARILYDNGIETLIQLANCDVTTIENILYKNIPFESSKLRDGETEYQHKHRNKFKNIWILGREGLIEQQAAEIILKHARQYLQIELGLKEAKWEKSLQSDEISSDCSLFETSINRTPNNSNDLIQASQEEDSVMFETNLKLTLSSRKRYRNDDNTSSPCKRSKHHQIRQQLDFEKVERFEIVDLCKHPQLSEIFQKEAMEQSVISLALACCKIDDNRPIIGVNSKKNRTVSKFTYKSCKLDGFAISWHDDTVYYFDLNQQESCVNLLELLLNNRFIKIRMFDSKEQLKLLQQLTGIDSIKAKFYDPKLGDWLLNPDSREKNFAAMVVTYSPNYTKLLQLCGATKGLHSASLNCQNREEARLRACTEALITFQLGAGVQQHLARENPKFLEIFDSEMACLKIVTKMELTGIETDAETFQNIIATLQQQCTAIERKAYNLTGRRFNLSSPKEIRKLLGGSKKQILEKSNHPLAKLILNWRKLHCIRTKTIQPLLRNVDNHRIYGNYIFHTATGRYSMHEPNLQNIAKTFQIDDDNDVQINCRRIFKSPQNWIFLSADYCQLELRLLTHLSRDEKLCRIMRQDGDIFRKIASKWNCLDIEQIDDDLRQRTKQLCYAMIYGMSTKTLSEQLNVDESEAIRFLTTFQQSYPSIQHYIRQTIENCRNHGYIETINGRRRYLPNINNEDVLLRQQAERQAINTTIQGSAADLVKQTMIKLDEEFEKIDHQYRPKLILHLHDELLYEVFGNQLETIARILKATMENSVNLSIPFPVKLKSGFTWGELVEYKL